MLFNELPKYSCSYSFRREMINSEQCYQKTYSRFGFLAESATGRTVNKLLFKKTTQDPITGNNIVEYTDEIYYECTGSSYIGTSYIFRTENNDFIIERNDKTAKTTSLASYYSTVNNIYNYTGWALVALLDDNGENVEVALPKASTGQANWRYASTIANFTATCCVAVYQ